MWVKGAVRSEIAELRNEKVPLECTSNLVAPLFFVRVWNLVPSYFSDSINKLYAFDTQKYVTFFDAYVFYIKWIIKICWILVFVNNWSFCRFYLRSKNILFNCILKSEEVKQYLSKGFSRLILFCFQLVCQNEVTQFVLYFLVIGRFFLFIYVLTTNNYILLHTSCAL